MANFRCDLIPQGSRVLCALSGGADSMYLLSRLLEAEYDVHAAHYNHNLRPTADSDEQFVRRWCDEHRIPLTVGSGDVAAYAADHGMGIEEAARELRYAFLQQTAAKTDCPLIATGHHALDNAETVLMNLIRGCGLNGLSGIPERRDNLVRPMLHVTKAEIDGWLDARGIPHVEDETNSQLNCTRNRIRHQIIPLLEELNPQAVPHIAAAALRATQDNGELSHQAELLLHHTIETEGGISISVDLLNQAPRPVSLRALSMLAPQARSVHLEGMLALCADNNPSSSLDIPDGTVRRMYGDLFVERTPVQSPLPAALSEGSQLWCGWRITCAPALCPQKAYVDPTCFYLRPDNYLIRSRQEGDVLRLGKRPEKTVKKLMIENKIPRHLRTCIPVLADNAGNAAAAGGLGPHWESLAQPNTQCLKITIRKEE